MAGLSPTACQRRLKRLRSEGIIQADMSAHLASYPLAMLYLGSRRPRSATVSLFKPVPCASDELRRAAGGSSASRLGFDEFS
ncbi:winged helix-turn-helix transcriptional regulator [Bradyrhizobium glycinis]|uniref:winged helix-turn-helix transcriptional regulator n=1 Tax=Bradyrhizobium glycinis TaxID=2751812 RepID=UPI0018D9335A|nr:winged helix-turn-helix transcriptional regulator [Bradyrhizobium glycinis]MBH5371003.1 winged helix-turn-helix transcriptional regulator [Bradyrhizobium glycinis]